MLRNLFLIALTLTLAIGAGAASAWYALRTPDGIGAIRVGAWTAYPNAGTPDADPYSKARVARDGLLALGQAEGLAFLALSDSAGDALQRHCDYKVEGSTPAARFWTLYVTDVSSSPLTFDGSRPAVQSQEILRAPDNTFSVAVGPHPAPGNWIRLQGSGAMALVLTLYDTPVASSSGVADLAMPQVLKTGCDA